MDERKIAYWQRLSTQLKALKAEEMALRKEICDEVLAGQMGTVKMELGSLRLKATCRYRRSIDYAAIESIWADLSPEEKAAIKFKPEVIESKYKQLPAACTVNQVIQSKPGSPSLKVETL